MYIPLLKGKNKGSLSSRDFKIEKILRECEHTQISLASWKSKPNKAKVVIKRMDQTKLKSWVITNEINAGKKLKHPGIAKFYGYFEESGHTYLIFEYVEGMDLFDYLEQSDFSPIPEDRTRKLFKQIVEIVFFIHKKGFVHRDLKLENIMLMPEDKIKLIDFGLSAELSCSLTGKAFLGSIEYVCPEIIKRQSYNGCKSEVFSLGVILYALLFGQFPFSTGDRELDDCQINFPSDVEVSQEVKDLLSNMLEFDPHLRYTIEDVLKHNWLKCK